MLPSRRFRNCASESVSRSSETVLPKFRFGASETVLPSRCFLVGASEPVPLGPRVSLQSIAFGVWAQVGFTTIMSTDAWPRLRLCQNSPKRVGASAALLSTAAAWKQHPRPHHGRRSAAGGEGGCGLVGSGGRTGRRGRQHPAHVSAGLRLRPPNCGWARPPSRPPGLAHFLCIQSFEQVEAKSKVTQQKA